MILANSRKRFIGMILLIGALLLTCGLSLGAAKMAEEVTVYFCDRSVQGNPRLFTSFSSVGFRFRVPEGNQLRRFTILAAPTWGDQANAGFTADIYAWQGDYEATLAGGLISSCLITGHRDNAALDLSFGYIPAGTYLINIHGFTAPIGTWESIGFPAEYSSSWGYYENGAEVTDYLPGTAMTIARDGDPHKVTPYVSPTIDPDAKETETPEEQTPAPTGPEKTRSRMTEMPEPVEENTGKAGLILGTAAGAVMIAGTAAAMLTVSRKDRKNPEQSAKN